MTTVDNNGGALTKFVGLFAMAELLKEQEMRIVEYMIMHPLQEVAVLNMGFFIEMNRKDLPPAATPMETSFMGIRIVTNDLFPKDRIEMRNAKHEVVCVIKNLAIPEVEVERADQ